jgi:hypothetical protein
MTAATRTNPIVRWWFAPAPAERLAVFRILVGLYVVNHLVTELPKLLGYNTFPRSEFKPHGIVRALTDAPLDPGLADALIFVALGLAVLFTFGLLHRVLAPVFAAVLLWVLTYRNSWSMLYHTENLEVLHVAIVAFAPASDAWSLDAWWRRRRGKQPEPADGRYGWPLRAAAMVTVIAYVLAGIAKLRLAGWDWLSGDQLRNQIAYDNLRRAVLGARPSVWATPMLEHPIVFNILAGMTMVVELGAPLALVHRRIALAWAAMAWGFHVGVLFLMHIFFPYPLFGMAFAPLFRLERPVQWGIGKVSRWRGKGPGPDRLR